MLLPNESWILSLHPIYGSGLVFLNFFTDPNFGSWVKTILLSWNGSKILCFVLCRAFGPGTSGSAARGLLGMLSIEAEIDRRKLYFLGRLINISAGVLLTLFLSALKTVQICKFCSKHCIENKVSRYNHYANGVLFSSVLIRNFNQTNFLFYPDTARDWFQLAWLDREIMNI